MYCYLFAKRVFLREIAHAFVKVAVNITSCLQESPPIVSRHEDFCMVHRPEMYFSPISSDLIFFIVRHSCSPSNKEFKYVICIYIYIYI